MRAWSRSSTLSLVRRAWRMNLSDSCETGFQSAWGLRVLMGSGGEETRLDDVPQAVLYVSSEGSGDVIWQVCDSE